MMNTLRSTIAIILLATATLAAQPAPPSTAAVSATSAPAKPTLTVAILDFSADVSGSDGLGQQIGQTLTAVLSDQAGFTLVDRATLTRTLQEHELNLTGLVDTTQAVQVGKLVGARLLITGKAFSLDKSIFITAKLIGTETGLVDGVLVKGKLGQDVGDLLMQLSEKLMDRVRNDGNRLVAADEPTDPLPGLKKQLAARKLPVIELQITEQHVSEVHVIDPPVQTELRKVLTDCGFTVLDSAEAAPANRPGRLIIKGEGVSEFGGHIGNLVTCTGRIELNVINSQDGTVLLADRTTARAVDLSEQIAGKTALQKGAHLLAVQLLQALVDKLPANK